MKYACSILRTVFALNITKFLVVVFSPQHNGYIFKSAPQVMNFEPVPQSHRSIYHKQNSFIPKQMLKIIFVLTRAYLHFCRVDIDGLKFPSEIEQT